MDRNKTQYQKQIFVCTNDRKGEKSSCGDYHGEEVFTELRRIAKERGFHPTIRVAQAKCLGQCAIGANVMVYPDNVWYSHVRIEDVQAIAEAHFPASQESK